MYQLQSACTSLSLFSINVFLYAKLQKELEQEEQDDEEKEDIHSDPDVMDDRNELKAFEFNRLRYCIEPYAKLHLYLKTVIVHVF